MSFISKSSKTYILNYEIYNEHFYFIRINEIVQKFLENIKIDKDFKYDTNKLMHRLI